MLPKLDERRDFGGVCLGSFYSLAHIFLGNCKAFCFTKLQRNKVHFRHLFGWISIIINKEMYIRVLDLIKFGINAFADAYFGVL